MLRSRWILLLGLSLVRAQGDDAEYTETYCGLQYDSCNDFCAPGASQIYRSDSYNRFPDTQITLSQDELQQFQSLQQEYLIAFGGKTMFNSPDVSLPGCGTNSTATTTTSRRLIRRANGDWNEEVTGNQDSQSIAKPNCVPETIQARVNFNIITTNITADAAVTLEMISGQFDKIVAAYEPLGIMFQKGAINRYTDSKWKPIAQQLHAPDMSKVNSLVDDIRQGGADEINVYVVEKIEDITCNKEKMTRVDGFCTFPSQAKESYDGCYIDIDSLPGSAWRGTVQGSGDALIHELGHWFGLRHVHVSSDDNCAAPESFYADTPSYTGSDQYTPLQKTCCADADGKFSTCNDSMQHVTNWMSFSEDRGKVDMDNSSYPWTLGQRAAVFANYYHFRRGTDKVTCTDGSSMYEKDPAPTKQKDSGMKDSNISKRATSNNIKGSPQKLLAQPIFIMDRLKEICAASDGGKTYEIDPITGKTLDGNSDNRNGPWAKLGQWRWVVITAIILVAIVVPMWAAMCLVRFRHKKLRANYAKIGEPAKGNKRFSFDSVLTLQTRTVESEKVLEAYRGTGPVRYA